jgi:hypothetical protein
MEGQRTRSPDSVAFTHSWYRSFLERIRDAGYEFRLFSDGVGSGDVLLRHDVDLSLEDAVRMARLEADEGVQATYCVLLTSALYNPLEGAQRERVREIASLGHEVVLHFSTHEYWAEEPSAGELLRRIDGEWTVLDTLVPDPPDTVAFHDPPSWVLGRSFDGVRNTYAPAYFTEIDYVADSGQRWREQPPSVEDLGESAQVLVHPGLWGETDEPFETRVGRSVAATCRHATEKARREFRLEDET